MRYKNDKQYQIYHHQISFSSSKCTKICFRPGLRLGPRWGSLRRSPRPSSRLERGIPPSPFPFPSRELGASVLTPSALNTKFWLRQWIVAKHTRLCARLTITKLFKTTNIIKLAMFWTQERVANAYCFSPGDGSPSATNVVLVLLVGVVCCCDLLKLFHFTTDRRQTLHTHKRQLTFSTIASVTDFQLKS